MRYLINLQSEWSVVHLVFLAAQVVFLFVVTDLKVILVISSTKEHVKKLLIRCQGRSRCDLSFDEMRSRIVIVENVWQLVKTNTHSSS